MLAEVYLLKDGAEEDDDAAADSEDEPDYADDASDDVTSPCEIISFLNWNHAGCESHNDHQE